MWPSSQEFFVALAEALIDNTFELRNLRKRQNRASFNDGGCSGSPSSLDADRQLCSTTPTKRMKKTGRYRAQGRCMTCTCLTINVCRVCQKNQPDPHGKQYWICCKPGMECMGAHILKKHSDRAKGTYHSVDSDDSSI